MARRRAKAPSTDGELILPRHLAAHAGLSGADYREFWKARNVWFREHGINPGDWSRVYPVLKATWNRYGVESSLDRHRRVMAARRQADR